MAMLTDLRQAVKAALDPALGIKLRSGVKLEGPLERYTGCVYSEGTQQVEEQVDDQLLVVTVRVFSPHRRRRSPRADVDVGSALEDAGELIQTTWRSHVHAGGVWFSWVTTVEINHDLQLVEAQIVARSANPAIVS